jgi:NhaP-type Na+/H+ or K+/H+ antiporter
VLTGAAVWLLRFCLHRQWLSPTSTKMTVIAVAFACFGAAQTLGGSGFIACFVGGLLFDGLFRPDHEKLLDAAEGIGDTFALLTWVVFGAAVVGTALGHLNWPVILYAALSLTVIRMLPVFVSVAGLGIGTEGKLFLGWFGPRGLASVVFAVMVINAGVPGSGTISAVVTWTVILSIVAHGVTANPWASAFEKRADSGT